MDHETWYVYVLKSVKTNEFYKGLTNNLERRLQEHIAGKEETTRKMLPLKLIYVEICSSRREARAIEKFLKSGFGREILKEI